MAWTVLKKTVPTIPTELPRERVADLLRTTANSLAGQTAGELFEERRLAQPGDGTAFVARVGGGGSACPGDGWGWLDDEARATHALPDGSAVCEWTRRLGFAAGGAHAVITRKRIALATAPELQFVHYLRIRDDAPKVPVTKDAIKVEPSDAASTQGQPATKKKKPNRPDDDFWGFEDQSVPSLVSLARFKRNHEFINELFSPLPIQPKEPFESKVNQEDIQKLEAEIKLLEEQHKKLLSNAAATLDSGYDI
ncbi:hypothetical protein BDR26DRAFT_918254 [Obelidium mucronatum]|nr:hypothetical protein BDR26DRAFT_918254 [Obelidium mucronatum]